MIRFFSTLVLLNLILQNPAFSANSSLEPNCVNFRKVTILEKDWNKIPSTVSMEWEAYDLDAMLPSGVKPQSPRDLGKNLAYLSLTRFHELFALHAKDSNEEWISEAVTEKIFIHPAFKKFREDPRLQWIPLKNKVFILANYDEVPPSKLTRLLETAIQIRGRDGKDLRMRKREEQWKEEDNWDALIPVTLAEEWTDRNRVFSGFEFPIEGKVGEIADLKSYLRNLWIKLGIYTRGSPALERELESVHGHVHWVPDIASAEKHERESYYVDMKANWGGTNELLMMRMILNSTPDALFSNEAYFPLTAKRYNSVQATENGFLVTPDKEGAFPLDLKWLPVGLRAIYGGEVQEAGESRVFLKPGLEFRGGRTLDENTSFIPGRSSNSFPDYSYGFSEDKRTCKQTALAQGLGEAEFNRLETLLKSQPRTSWSVTDKRAFLYSPFRDFKGHPFVESEAHLKEIMNEQKRFVRALRNVTTIEAWWKAVQRFTENSFL